MYTTLMSTSSSNLQALIPNTGIKFNVRNIHDALDAKDDKNMYIIEKK